MSVLYKYIQVQKLLSTLTLRITLKLKRGKYISKNTITKKVIIKGNKNEKKQLLQHLRKT